MSIYIKDPATDKAVRELAKLRGLSLTEAIREAVERAIGAEKAQQKDEFLSKIRELQAEVARWPDTGLKADKAFFDSLSGLDD